MAEAVLSETGAGHWLLHKETDTLNPAAVFDGTNTTVALP